MTLVVFNFRVIPLQSPVLKEPKVVTVQCFVLTFCFRLQYQLLLVLTYVDQANKPKETNVLDILI